MVPAVKREAYLEKRPHINSSYVNPCAMSAALVPHQVVDDFQKILHRGEQYFDKLKGSSNGAEQKIDKQVFVNLLTFTDEEFVNMLEGISLLAVLAEDMVLVP